MKYLFLVSGLLFVSCSSVERISGNMYKCNASSIWGSCKEEIKTSCPKGHKVESSDSSYSWGGHRDTVYYSCTNG